MSPPSTRPTGLRRLPGMARVIAVVAVGLCLGSSGLLAQPQPGTVELTRQVIETQRRFIIGGSLPLTAEEGQGFWPLFEEYQSALDEVRDKEAQLITSFVAPGPGLGDRDAQTMLRDALSIEERRLKLKKTYVSKMGKVLPPAKLLRYFQLENKLDAVVAYDLAQRIPLAQ